MTPTELTRKEAMTLDEFSKAFAGHPPNHSIKVLARSGKAYWIHADQIPAIQYDGLIYGVFVAKHLRSTTEGHWLKPSYLRLA